jgi:hypothetical protein
VIYPGRLDAPKRAALLKKLGKHKANVSCVYINKLADVDQKALAELIEHGVKGMQQAWAVSAS